MIKPTIGRVVWFHRGSESQDQPHPAIVCYVHSDTCVNLAVFDANGNQYSVTSVTLLQDDDRATSGRYAEWMPYQKHVAEKSA